MGKRKRPEGAAWEEFVETWYACNHAGKVALAVAYGTTYDVAKHWISDTGATKEPVVEEPANRITLDELLGMRPAVNLDFVAFDIETSNLKADFSIVLTAAIKPYGQPPIAFRADDYPTWSAKRADDSAIVAAIAGELRKHAIVVSHYGERFDIPYLRAKMVRHGLEPLPPMFGIDSWRIAKTNFAVSSRRLKNLAAYFDIGEKDSVEGRLWMEAAYEGSKEAMDKVLEHNIQDTIVLERLACLSFPYLKSIPRL